jgi:signal transduction histidine kinase
MDPFRADLLLAALFLLEFELEVLMLVQRGEAAGGAAIASVALAAGIALRRRAPLASVAISFAAFFWLQTMGRAVNDELVLPFFTLLFVMYSAGVHLDGWRLPAAGLLAFGLAAISTAFDSYPTTVSDFIFGATAVSGGPLLLGRVLSNRTRLNRTLREKADRLRREQAEQGERAVADERARIAGELHDVVAHAMSAMVVQASGARRLAAKDPERSREAFATVEATGRDALAEIRRLLGVLRHEDEEIALAPQPSLRHVEALVRRTEAAGLPVRLSVEGEERELPGGVDLTAYRLVQEALGGALEQGAAGRAEVTVRYLPDGVELEVLDDGAAGAPRHLPGVSERVGLYGGQLHAGSRRRGGHAVRARLPVGGAS